MELDFTHPAAQDEAHDPAVARKCFESFGKMENFAEMESIFLEGQTIMKEGDAGVSMYIVVRGRVSVSIKATVVERVGPGGTFGEMALVDHTSRAATAVAETECQLLSISRNDFLNLVKTKPGFAISLLKTIADRLRNMTQKR